MEHTGGLLRVCQASMGTDVRLRKHAGQLKRHASWMRLLLERKGKGPQCVPAYRQFCMRCTARRVVQRWLVACTSRVRKEAHCFEVHG